MTDTRRVRFEAPTMITGLTIHGEHYTPSEPTFCYAMRWYALELDHDTNTLRITEEEAPTNE